MTTIASAPGAPGTPTPSPLHLVPAETFALLRSFLRESGFDEGPLCERLGIASIDHLRSIRDGRPVTPVVDPLDLLIRLFLDNEPVPWDTVERIAPARVAEALRTTGLLRDHRRNEMLAVPNVLLYPTESLYIASDVAMVPDGDGDRWWDLVYAAITTNTRAFLAGIPRTPCDALLDLCSGTGIAALAAARQFATHAWAVDVAERSTAFAEFNAALNEVSNVTMLTGDLYAPVSGRTFDRIVAHPPYVPSRETTMVYRDGGSDGEDVTRRIVAGLPQHLRDGGDFQCVCTATDRRDAPLERRVRAMLGDAEREFDVAVVVTSEFDPTEYYVRLAIAGRGTWAEAESWHHHFAGLGVTKLVYATIVIHRHERAHESFTVRRRAGSATGPTELARLVRAAEATTAPEALDGLLGSRPSIPAHVTLETTHSFDEGLAMRGATIGTGVPFDVRLPCAPPMVPLLARIDGRRTVRELYAEIVREGGATDDASLDQFASYLHILAAHGLVTLTPSDEG